MRFDLRISGRSVDVALPLAGPHLVESFLPAAAVAYILGVDVTTIAERAATLTPARHRGEVRRLGQNIILIDDSYNSSPVALEASVVALTLSPGRRRVAILGDMLELGPSALRLHRESGLSLAGRVDLAVGVGALSKEILAGAREAGLDASRLVHFDEASSAAAAIGDVVQAGDAVLVKGSRSLHLEQVVDALDRHFGEGKRA